MSKKGSTWKTHKYIRIENGRYIYSEGGKTGSKKSSFSYGQGTSKDRAATVNEIHEFLKKFKVTKGKGKSSSSKTKGSGSKKESTGSKGSSSKEKTEKTSTSSKSEATESKTTTPEETKKKTKKVDETYTEVLERMQKEDKTELPKVREKQPELEKKKKLRHEDMDKKIYTSMEDRPSIDDLIIQHYGVKGMRWRHRKGRKFLSPAGRRTKEHYRLENVFNKHKNQYLNARTEEERRAHATAAGNAGYKLWNNQYEVVNIGGREPDVRKKKRKLNYG